MRRSAARSNATCIVPLQLAVLILSVMASACSDGSVTPTAPIAPAFAKGGGPGGGSGTSDLQASFALAGPGSGTALEGDGLPYEGGACGVKATIFLSNGGGDAVMQTDNPKAKARNCGWPRSFMITHGGLSETTPGSISVRAIGFMDIGQTATTVMGVATSAAGSVCGGVRQMTVNVTRVDAGTWEVSTPGTTGTCESDGTSRQVGAFSLTITAS